MALRKIITDSDSSLRKKSRPVEKFDRRLHALLDDMTETLADACGAGLAAPQIGVLRRVCIVNADEERGLVELINPVITRTEGEQEGPEGCLSVPGKTGIVKRPFRVWVDAFDRSGKPFSVVGEDFEARAFCHEIDHLDGKLYTDIVIRYMTAEEIAALSGEDD